MPLHSLFIQTMSIAIEIEETTAAKLESGLGIAFRVKLYHWESVCCHKYNKRNVVLLRHGVVNRDEVLILHIFN